MTRKEFEKIVADIGLSSVPEKFRDKIKNVAFIVEGELSNDVRKAEGLSESETLLGLYHGIPHTERGDDYGTGPTLPDTITLYQKPIEEEARETGKNAREVIAETIWHEVAHHFGLNHSDIEGRYIS